MSEGGRKLVLPVPPGPTTVTTEVSGEGRSFVRVASSSCLPRREGRRKGRLVGWVPAVRRAGKSAVRPGAMTWYSSTRWSMSLRGWGPRECRVTSLGGWDKSPAVADDSKIWAPHAAAEMRAPKWTSSPT